MNNKDVKYIRENTRFFRFHDFDQNDLLNQMTKIKDKRINSPDF